MDLLDAAIVATGQPARRLMSGAGHDAMAMASLGPVAMLFVRCAGGISHHPAEHVDPADADAAVAAAKEALRTALASLDTPPAPASRRDRGRR